MNMPTLTAEASLYPASGHYWSNPHRMAASIGMTNVIYPAEIVEVHGCAPGSEVINWSDGTWSCEPVGPNPSPWGQGGGAGVPEYEGEPRPSTGGGKTPRDRPKKKKVRDRQPGRSCVWTDGLGDPAQAELDCASQGPDRILRCFDKPDGSSVAVCCHRFDRKRPWDLLCLGV